MATPDRLSELMNHMAVLQHVVLQLWVREFAKSETPIEDAKDYIKRMNEAFSDAPVPDVPEAVAMDLQENMTFFFDTVLATLRRELERGRLDA